MTTVLAGLAGSSAATAVGLEDDDAVEEHPDRVMVAASVAASVAENIKRGLERSRPIGEITCEINMFCRINRAPTKVNAPLVCRKTNGME